LRSRRARASVRAASRLGIVGIRIRFLTGAMLAGLAIAGPVAARDLTVALRGGAEDAALREVYVRPFAAATAIPIHADARWDGQMEGLRAQAKPDGDGWDLVLADSATLQPACDEGLLEKLDWGAIGGKERYFPIAVSDCGVGVFLSATVLSWDRDKLSAAPGWGEFFDVARIPGKRGLSNGPRGNLEIALLADGVAPGDVYKQLRGAEGVDRAFRKLDQLRPFVVWWGAGNSPLDLLASGEVLMTSAPNTRISAANAVLGRNFGVQWTGGLSRVHYWAVVKGSPNLKPALQFLYFAGTSAIQARLLPNGGLTKASLDFMPAEAQAVSPVLPANMGAMLPVDEAFWRENGEKLTQRFNAWLAR